MTIKEAIFRHLTTNAGLAALVGDRVYPKKLPQPKPPKKPTLPAIVYHRITTPREHDQDGSANLHSPLWQFDCFATTDGQASEVARVLRLALDGFAGTMGGVGGVAVDAAFVEDEQDDYDDTTEFFRSIVDFTIMHHE